MAFCSRCGSQLDPSWKSCPNCGQQIVMVRTTGYTCPNCGNPVNRGQVICVHCGMQLRSLRTTSNIDRLAKASYYWVIILIIIIIVIAGVFFTIFSSISQWI